jgi:hypothetical protein
MTLELFSVRQNRGGPIQRVPKARRNRARSVAQRSSGLPKPVDQIPNPEGVTEALRGRWLNRAGFDGHRSAGRQGDLRSFRNDPRSSAGASLRALLAPHLWCFLS